MQHFGPPKVTIRISISFPRSVLLRTVPVFHSLTAHTPHSRGPHKSRYISARYTLELASERSDTTTYVHRSEKKTAASNPQP